MQIHVPTLYYLMCGVTLLAAGKMAMEWRRSRSRPLLWWSLGNLAVAIATLLTSLRPLGHLNLGIGLSNALMFIGYAVSWHGAAVFTGKRAPWSLVFLGAVVWTAAWNYPPFADDVDLRILLGSAIVAAYSFATAFCFLRARERLVAGTQAGVAFLLHGLVYLVRIGSLPIFSGNVDPLQINNLPLALVMFEGVLFVVVTAYLFLAMSRERGDQLLMAASQIDYLTGVPNRRAFTERARRLVAGGGVTAALIFDLDHFKSINDRHGHALGDEVLKLFCRVAQEQLAPDDVFGRMGGEEFAVILAGHDTDRAQHKGISIIRHFAAEARGIAGQKVGATVSAGLTVITVAGDLDDLLAEADAALYQAKRDGRNRLGIADANDVDPQRASSRNTRRV
jgi:diguanylate cyclase (GGDEF)-like protein